MRQWEQTGGRYINDITVNSSAKTFAFSGQSSNIQVGWSSFNNANAQTSFSTTALSADVHLITAVYLGDINHISSASSVTALTVNKAATTVSLASALNPSTYLGEVTYTATVSSTAGGIATGNIIFKDGSTTIGTGTLSGGVATVSVANLSAGAHAITAVYSGDSSYATSTSNAVAQTVNMAATTVVLASTLNPSTYLGEVTYTATVSSIAGGIATGNVIFKDGSTTIGTGTLSGGVATVSLTSLSVGSHTITAVYSGDSNYVTSTSNTLTQTVNKAATSVALTSALNPSTYLGEVTYTATVSSTGGGIATGNIIFKDGSTTIGTATLSGGVATASTTTLSLGAHTITAVYSGDSNYVTSTSNTLTQMVNKAATTVALTSTLNPSTYLGEVTYTATVSSLAGGIATGNVIFKDGSTTIGTATLSGGVATVSITSLSAGAHTITAIYSGDSNYSAKSSESIFQIVLNISLLDRNNDNEIHINDIINLLFNGTDEEKDFNYSGVYDTDDLILMLQYLSPIVNLSSND